MRRGGERGQSMIEYLIIAGTVIAVLAALRGRIQGAADGVMADVNRQLTTIDGTADALLPAQ